MRINGYTGLDLQGIVVGGNATIYSPDLYAMAMDSYNTGRMIIAYNFRLNGNCASPSPVIISHDGTHVYITVSTAVITVINDKPADDINDTDVTKIKTHKTKK